MNTRGGEKVVALSSANWCNASGTEKWLNNMDSYRRGLFVGAANIRNGLILGWTHGSDWRKLGGVGNQFSRDIAAEQCVLGRCIVADRNVREQCIQHIDNQFPWINAFSKKEL